MDLWAISPTLWPLRHSAFRKNEIFFVQKIRNAKSRDAKNRDAKNRNAKNRDAKKSVYPSVNLLIKKLLKAAWSSGMILA